MSYSPLLNPIFTGNPRVPTAGAGDNDTSAASTAFVTGAISTAGSGYVTLAGTQTITGEKTFEEYILVDGATGGIDFSNSAQLRGSGTAASDIFISALVVADGNNRFETLHSGKLQWGSGAAGADTTLERASANILQIGADDFLRLPTAPAAATDAVNKAYVDAIATGLDWKGSARAATAAALPAYTRTSDVITAGAFGALAAVDGVTLVLNDRLLLKNGAAGADNGLYFVSIVGDGATAFTLTRTTDADTSAEVTGGLAVFIEEGTANADKGFVLTTNNAITLNTTALTFTQFTSSVSASALDDLTDVDVTGAADGALLRYESAGTQWNDTVTLLYSDAGQLQATTTGSGGGLLLGGDAQWYRSAADTMRTPDALVVDLTSTLTGAVTATAGVTSPAGYTATSTGTVATDSGNISSTSGNLVITAGTATIGGKLTYEAGVNVKTATKTSNYAAAVATDHVIFCDSTGGAFTITLPAAHAEGDTLVIKDAGGGAETNNITVDPADADTVDGLSTFVLTVNYQGVSVISDGTNWFVV